MIKWYCKICTVFSRKILLRLPSTSAKIKLNVYLHSIRACRCRPKPSDRPTPSSLYAPNHSLLSLARVRAARGGEGLRCFGRADLFFALLNGYYVSNWADKYSLCLSLVFAKDCPWCRVLSANNRQIVAQITPVIFQFGLG